MTINKYVEAEQRTSPAARYNGLFLSVSHWIFQWKVDKSEDIARLAPAMAQRRPGAEDRRRGVAFAQ
jgi:hypothetical protein